MARLPTVTPRQIIAALRRAGFEIDHQTGSHIVLYHVTNGRRTTVPYHNRDLGRGLTRRIISQAGLTRNEFITLLK